MYIGEERRTRGGGCAMDDNDLLFGERAYLADIDALRAELDEEREKNELLRLKLSVLSAEVEKLKALVPGASCPGSADVPQPDRADMPQPGRADSFAQERRDGLARADERLDKILSEYSEMLSERRRGAERAEGLLKGSVKYYFIFIAVLVIAALIAAYMLMR